MVELPAGWTALDFTFVYYEKGNTWSLVNAASSLVPQCLVLVFLAAFVCRRELELAYFIVGQGSSTIVNKILKDAIKQPRPPRKDFAEPFLEAN
jgi:hypothetical protein